MHHFIEAAWSLKGVVAFCAALAAVGIELARDPNTYEEDE